ncbi:DUF1415 domain-containing protein [Thalassotalea ganghwensis]
MQFSNMPNNVAVIKTQRWIEQVIVGFNFCPFAKKELLNNRIYYHVVDTKKMKLAVNEVIEQCQYLCNNPQIETTLALFPEHYNDFYRYLTLVELCNEALLDDEYEGVFQLASFHPEYCFEGEPFDDPANFTNRSPYPTIHIIREESLEKVLSLYKAPETIPINNINFARSKGTSFFQNILQSL